MSGRFVRASKFRHVYGQPKKRDQYYDNLRVSKNASDSNLLKVNARYVSVNWEAGGGGAFAVIPLAEHGKLPDLLPLFRGHTAAVLDTDWNPFDDALLASGADDGKICLWKVPEDFSIRRTEDEITDVAPLARLSGHSRKVGQVSFSPTANNVLASASGDYSLKIWDVEKSVAVLSMAHPDVIQHISFHGNGSLLASTCRDKRLRIWDPRQQTAVAEMASHTGAKGSRVVWLGGMDRIATTGFSRMSDRQLALWDTRSLDSGPLGGFSFLDQSAGICMPFWDEGTQMLYVAGKGDGNIRYYELVKNEFLPLSEFKSVDPTRGFAFMPKRALDLEGNELMRAYRTVNDAFIEPISFFAPRRVDAFQPDLFPPAPAGVAALQSAEWFEGKDAEVVTVDLETIYRDRGGVNVAPSTPVPEQKATAKIASTTPSAQVMPTSTTPASVTQVQGPALVPKVTSKGAPTEIDQLLANIKVEDDEPEPASEWDQDEAIYKEIKQDAEEPRSEKEEVASIPAQSAQEPEAPSAPSETTPLLLPPESSPIHSKNQQVDHFEQALQELQVQQGQQAKELAARDEKIQTLQTTVARLESMMDETRLRRLELEVESLKSDLLGVDEADS